MDEDAIEKEIENAVKKLEELKTRFVDNSTGRIDEIELSKHIRANLS